ncbi:MAG: hypothetical protein ACR2PL_25575 [Dehalococcoidia bacterium]
MRGTRIDPFLVRFSQDSINHRFRSGETIEELAADLRNGRVAPNSMAPIRLVERGGLLFTLDNRRLEAFRRAREKVPYRMATAEEDAEEAWKFTTTNQGVSVRIRG